MQNNKYIPLGCYADECRSLLSKADIVADLLTEYMPENTLLLNEFKANRDNWNNPENSEMLDDWIQDALNALQEHCMPYTYLGWFDGSICCQVMIENLEYAFDGLKVTDTSEVPNDYSGEVIHVNDHGNMTLYAAESGKLTEIWGIV